jgi:hypothetical protein
VAISELWRSAASGGILQADNLGTNVPRLRHLFPLPTLCDGVPNAVGEQPIQIRKVRIAVDEEVQPFAILLARPLAIPDFASRIIRVEVQAAQCLPTATRTAFNVAASAMAFADTRTAIGTGSEFLAQASVPSSTSAAKRYTASCAIIRWSPCEAVEHLRDAGR